MSTDFDFDTEVDEDGVAREVKKEDQEKDWFDSLLDWCGEHKIAVCLSLIGLPLFLIWFGARCFSTHTTETEQIEVKEPTPFDDLTPVPVKTTTTTTYEWVPKQDTTPIE